MCRRQQNSSASNIEPTKLQRERERELILIIIINNVRKKSKERKRRHGEGASKKSRNGIERGGGICVEKCIDEISEKNSRHKRRDAMICVERTREKEEN